MVRINSMAMRQAIKPGKIRRFLMEALQIYLRAKEGTVMVVVLFLKLMIYAGSVIFCVPILKQDDRQENIGTIRLSMQPSYTVR
jgi:hypothetical protein